MVLAGQFVTFSFDEAAALHACSEDFAIHEHRVRHDEFEAFSNALESLRVVLGDLEDDITWQPAIGRLRRLRFDMMAAPLLFGDAGGQDARERLAGMTPVAQQTLPRAEPAIAHTIECLDALAETTANPILDAIAGEAATAEARTIAVLLCESRLIGPARTAAGRVVRQDGLQWMAPQQLRAADRMDCVVVVGAPRWFPQHVFRAPRAPMVASVRHGWLGVNWNAVFSPAFEKAEDEHPAPRNRQPAIRPDSAWQGGREPTGVLDEAAAFPHRAGSELFGRLGKEAGGHPVSEVEAVAVRVEGDGFVLVERDNSPYVIDPGEDYRVRPVSAPDIPSGAFLLVRTEGGGDYVVEVADNILGAHRDAARAGQNLWKERLREAVDRRGVPAVVKQMEAHGSGRAEANLRNWMSASPRNIRTDAPSDFAAILAVGGLADRTDEMWRTMGRILWAHRTAGQRIRKRLMAEVAKADPQELERDGRRSFEMDAGGGSLTAFRVVEVLPDPVPATRSNLGRLIRA